MKDLEALPIEIDNYTIYVTNMIVNDNGSIEVKILPDKSLPSYFTDVFISDAVCSIILSKHNKGK